MNWGTKLIIGMLLFMSFIVVLGVLMVRSDNDALVETNYYEKGLNYDQEYAAKTQVGKDQASPVTSITAAQISIQFKTSAKGKIMLTRNDSKSADTTISFTTNTGIVNFNIIKMAKGRWHMIASWENPEGTKYLKDEEVYLP
jgi:hypothetical protein